MSSDNEDLRQERVYSGATERDNRTHFQRDRDRILYTPAFRRLGGVAQVVHVSTERGYHNRLTHSLKVAQVGRRLAESLLNTTDSTTIEEAGGLDQDVVETACLAHDLGHPPFGHPAESAIQDQIDSDDGFEGNPQSFRIVNNVAIHKQPYGDTHRGLDLTLASLNAILKYPWQRSPVGKKSKKWGYYTTEQEEFNRTQELRTPGNDSDSKSLEAQIMDWADDLTYAIHDLVDFYKAGLIPLDELIRSSAEQEVILDKFEADYERDIDGWDGTGFLEQFLPGLAKVATTSENQSSFNNQLDTPFRSSSTEQAVVSFMSSELVERYLGQWDDVNVTVDPGIRGGLDIDPILRHEINLLQFLSEYYVFNDPALLAQQEGHRKIVTELFDLLLRAAEDNGVSRGLLPPPFDEKIDRIEEDNLGYSDIEPETLRNRIVADIIASMTEQQAMELYERITGRSPGLVTDRII